MAGQRERWAPSFQTPTTTERRPQPRSFDATAGRGRRGGRHPLGHQAREGTKPINPEASSSLEVVGQVNGGRPHDHQHNHANPHGGEQAEVFGRIGCDKGRGCVSGQPGRWALMERTDISDTFPAAAHAPASRTSCRCWLWRKHGQAREHGRQRGGGTHQHDARGILEAASTVQNPAWS